MDEASSLVAELQQKLAALDHKVWQYRHDMTSEFERFTEGLLRGVDKSLSETVARTIQESIRGYKALYPEGIRIVNSCSGGSGNSTTGDNELGNTKALPMSFRRPDDPEHKAESPSSPHAREMEFQGVFTPSFLPLLDDREARRASMDSATSGSNNKEKMRATDTFHVDASTEVGKSLLSSPAEPRRPTPRRKNTDEVSNASDISDVPRRSALRRSSSASKGAQSPRRVRFDMEDGVVLPTSSPLPAAPIAEEEYLGTPAFPSDDEEEGTCSQIEDIDSPPPPKRISSSQRLRMLSRSPLDESDGTVWTAVTAPPDGSASVSTTRNFNLEEYDDKLDKDSSTEAGVTQNEALETTKPEPSKTEGGMSEDDEVLDMPSFPRRSKTPKPASILSPAIPKDISDNKLPTASTRSASIDLLGEDHPTKDNDLEDFDVEDMFHFDDAAAGVAALTSARLVLESDSDSEALSISPIKTRNNVSAKSPKTEPKTLTLSAYSSSPARQIPTAQQENNKVPEGVGSLRSSYKNHPFNTPIVNAEMLAKVEKMGDVESTFGSFYGGSGAGQTHTRNRSGEGYGGGSLAGVGSGYRMGSVTNYGSLGHRMMIEDRVKAEEDLRKSSAARKKSTR